MFWKFAKFSLTHKPCIWNCVPYHIIFIHNVAELVERVFLKFVLADTDEKLEKSFDTFLTPVLLKLGSKSEAVKNKVQNL